MKRNVGIIGGLAALSLTVMAGAVYAQEVTVLREGCDADGIAWTEREVPVKTSDQPGGAGTVQLRFYEDMPNVAYIQVNHFHELVRNGEQAELAQAEDGVWQWVNSAGEAKIDTDLETISFDDYYAFTDTAGSSQTAKTGEMLDDAPYCLYDGMDTDPEAGKVEFDFAKYGIDLREDEEGAYVPFTTLSNLYDDSSFLHRAVYNMQEVVLSYGTEDLGSDCVDENWYAPFRQMEERPEDLAAYSYAELCFALEHFYGCPGRERIDEKILKEEGLEAALKAYGEMGENAVRLLQSTDMAEYLAGSERLRLLFWDGDHTNIEFVYSSNLISTLQGQELLARLQKLDEELDDGYDELKTELLMKAKSDESSFQFAKAEQRKKSLGEGTYFAKGNTAWCVFDGFELNKGAWDAYYADENRDLDAFLENTPDDSIVILLNALKKAQADPEIKNFVVDMSLNPGGNDGTGVALESLLTGVAKRPVRDMLTGYPFIVNSKVDRNFDGVFDEKDDEVTYDFHFAILVSSTSYSNGTISPAALKDSGILILGEKTRGGGCSLQMLSTAEGLEFLMSSSRMHHTYKNGEGIDAGVEPDIELYRYDENGEMAATEKTNMIYEQEYTIMIPDYSLFYDIEYVGKVIDEYYAQNS